MALTPVSRGALLKDTRASAQTQNKLQSSRNTEDFIREITAEWGNLRQSFLRIGQYLVTAKLNLPHGDYIKMINECLPFGRNVAHQLATVYLAVAAEEMPAEVLPSSYTTCYRIARLDPDLRRRAIAEGVVHQRTTFKDIAAFVASVEPHDRSDTTQLEAEAARLNAELAGLRVRERQILHRLQEISTALSHRPLSSDESAA